MFRGGSSRARDAGPADRSRRRRRWSISVWGESGMAALWGAATVKLIGAGVHSPRLARDLAALVGQHDVPVRSITPGESRGVSENISLRRQDILEPADIAAIPQSAALLLTSGKRPALLRLRNWFNGLRQAEIATQIGRAMELIQVGASQRDMAPP